MNVRVVEAKWLKDFVVWTRFDDGVAGEIDLGEELEGPVFEPLRDESYFRRLQVHPELHTLVWPNGADFAPEFLYQKVKVPA